VTWLPLRPVSVCWLAGQADAVSLFAQGVDIYVDMAARMYSIPGAIIARGNAAGELKYLKMRALGKAIILGCGFGMGWERFIETCAKAPYFLTIDKDTAKKAVNTYRTVFAKVPALWTDVEDAAIKAVLTGAQVTAAGGKVTFKVVENRTFKTLLCKLPSGRKLSFPYPEVRPRRTPWGEVKPAVTFLEVDKDTAKTHQWRRGDTYGGKLVENIVQAIARDLMAHGMKRAIDDDFEVFMTVHDEVCALAKIGARSLADFLAHITAVPAWGEGIPVAAEGYTAEHYRK